MMIHDMDLKNTESSKVLIETKISNVIPLIWLNSTILFELNTLGCDTIIDCPVRQFINMDLKKSQRDASTNVSSMV